MSFGISGRSHSMTEHADAAGRVAKQMVKLPNWPAGDARLVTLASPPSLPSCGKKLGSGGRAGAG
jgi:hypothetical protein